jgi:hypothetical protein
LIDILSACLADNCGNNWYRTHLTHVLILARLRARTSREAARAWQKGVGRGLRQRVPNGVLCTYGKYIFKKT